MRDKKPCGQAKELSVTLEKPRLHLLGCRRTVRSLQADVRKEIISIGDII